MHVEMRPIGSIMPYANNPRINEAGVDAVAASLKEFGWRSPIVVDEADVIVAGHTRLLAAKKLGLTEVPVHVASGLSAEQVRAYRLADNQTATLSDWNFDLLPIEIAGLKEADYDLGLLGFDPEELARLLAGPEAELIGDPEEVPEPPDDPITRPGDLWLLGRHRLLCGDATDAGHVGRLMDGDLADLLLTDPPYGVAYVGKTSDALTIDNDDLGDEAYREFLASAIGNGVQHLVPGGPFYVWHADSRGLVVRQACNDAGLEIRQALIWAKNAMVLGRQDYQWKHEPCLYGWKEGAAHRWYGGRDKVTILQFDRPSRSTVHPTTKPIDLMMHLLANSCPPGGLVLDLFGGSGSTLVAAEQAGARANLLELDPRYVDVIVRRWEKVTGKTAVREAAK